MRRSPDAAETTGSVAGACSTRRSDRRVSATRQIGWSRIGSCSASPSSWSRWSCSTASCATSRSARWSQALRDDRRRATSRSRRCSSPRGYFTLTFYDLFALRTIGRARRALSGRGARRLHQLFGRPQCRRQRVHRRRGALPHLFGLGARRDRGGEDLLRRRADVLARQRRPCSASASPMRRRPRRAIDQLPPWFNRVARDRDPGRAGDLCRAGSGARRA